MKLIKSISGIRGIVGKNLDTDITNHYSAIFSNIQEDGNFLVARDSRPHGKDIYDEICKILTSLGRDVISCDIIPTPTAQYIIKEKKLAGGIVITASHNPIEWNGLKFLDNDGCFLNSKKMKLILSKEPSHPINDYTGDVKEAKNAYQHHIQNILNLNCINIDKIKNKNFKVVIDTVNGAAYKALPELLEKLNCNVIKIHCDNDGTFPRGTEPIPTHLEDLSKAVIKNNADIGFATDPDADRLAIVDNHGNPIGEESTLVLALESYLKYYKDSQKVVTNLSTSMAVDVIAHQYNSTVQRSSVGEINVVEKMKKLGSTIGGEGNGGVILKESHLGRDSLVASALILNHLAQSELPFDKILENIPRFFMIKDKISLQDNIELNHIKTLFQNNDVTFIEDDGLKIIWEDKWVHIRKSNTEPIIRIISEATNHKTARGLIDSLRDNISS
tara:strand:+ start:46 stop:1380 length:1335 start_codon:yes stop_codon:yes gene_type:complete